MHLQTGLSPHQLTDLLDKIAVSQKSQLFVWTGKLKLLYPFVNDLLIEQTFKELVPNEKNIVKPLVQLQQKLTEFQQDQRQLVPWTTAHPGLMTILYQISTTSALQSDVVLKDLLVYKTLIEINASSASPAQAKQWQQQLSALPHFTNVEMQDPRLNPDTQQFDFKMVVKAQTPRGHHETQ